VEADAAVAAVDRWIDERFDAIRGRPVADRVMYTASTVGEHGTVWLLMCLVLLVRPTTRRRALRALVWLGIESVLVNGPMKMAFRRERPDAPDEHPHRLRAQTSSSFPSGHSASSAAMATILSEGSPLAPVWWAVALTIAASRIHVRDHHASDVLGGLLIGTGMGVAGRHLGPHDASTGRGVDVVIDLALDPGGRVRGLGV
jgi:undecaprenyl-diphosphatase